MASSQMIALLGLLAVAGYQNRDKIGELLGGATGGNNAPGNQPAGSTGAGVGGGLLAGLGGLLGGSTPGGGIASGLRDIVDSFSRTGHGDTAASWVTTGANREVSHAEIGEAVGDDSIATLMKQTGLSRDELLMRLKAVLPTAVDKLTPAGRLPTDEEASRWVAPSA